MTDPIRSAYRLLEASLVYHRGDVVGTIASLDSHAPADNYSDCFVRDFVPSALVFLLDGRGDIVRNFLSLVLKLRDQQEEVEGHRAVAKVMPASFRVLCNEQGQEEIHTDFGDRAIGRVAPVDSMMWWLILLVAYERVSGDTAFTRSRECQRGIRMILNICLQDRFEIFPTLLVPDGSFMVDRRMGVYGHPLEIQSLFFGALKAALAMLDDTEPDNQGVREQSTKRLEQLVDYVRHYYWLDDDRLNRIHRFRTEIFGYDSENALNIHPESIPDWVSDWLPLDAGYLVGNLGPGRMDFRFFALGNLLSVLFGLADESQSRRVMHLYDQRWDDLMGMMPVKLCFPAMQGEEWRLKTGSDPKNIPWSYHNGGNWPALLWAFTAAALHAGRGDLALRAREAATRRLAANGWPEYYDGRNGRLIGRRANYNQTWSATALILTHKFIDDPSTLDVLSLKGFEKA
ncbi:MULTISPECIES: glycoside hydrolase 100 family protein [unclassified Ectothiorhodospira]|uniref:glycoside hydrolase 100 family protein n=1 Tax=unclassified Ectothiorhodospira TaxID=2684909 RepID=UPI001EE93AB9|nr:MULTISPECIES: glycoside hydrolase 100 family protein [unclassified Ectothiorhodospira]MCG5515180.1 glycoside hydrolase 100 family protein [Ectothiorhodospira sp. 9100]MCG5519509.1 glycoside hydrolase 100 family protein [Ectothiorhodospira sp. 9905]